MSIMSRHIQERGEKERTVPLLSLSLPVDTCHKIRLDGRVCPIVNKKDMATVQVKRKERFVEDLLSAAHHAKKQTRMTAKSTR